MSDINPSGKRRFIAGAICPRCKTLDTIVVYQQDGRDFRACVACDFEEGANFQHVGRELTTRVNEPHRQQGHDQANEVSVVTIVDPTKDPKNK